MLGIRFDDVAIRIIDNYEFLGFLFLGSVVWFLWFALIGMKRNKSVKNRDLIDKLSRRGPSKLPVNLYLPSAIETSLPLARGYCYVRSYSRAYEPQPSTLVLIGANLGVVCAIPESDLDNFRSVGGWAQLNLLKIDEELNFNIFELYTHSGR